MQRISWKNNSVHNDCSNGRFELSPRKLICSEVGHDMSRIPMLVQRLAGNSRFMCNRFDGLAALSLRLSNSVNSRVPLPD